MCEYAVNCINHPTWDRSSCQEMCDDASLAWAERTIRSYSQPEYCDYETARMVKLALHVFIRLYEERMRYFVSDGNREYDDNKVAQGIKFIGHVSDRARDRYDRGIGCGVIGD